jgi:hypothetical protein
LRALNPCPATPTKCPAPYGDAKRVPMPVKIIDGMCCLNYHDDRLGRLKLQGSASCCSNAAKRQLPGQSKRARLADGRLEECESSDEDEDIDCADIYGDREDEDIHCADIDGDRVHTRLVCYTVGRNIHEFSSVRELLEAFRDAIKCKPPFILFDASHASQVTSHWSRRVKYSIATYR